MKAARRLGAVLVLILSVCIFAGCGGSSDGSVSLSGTVTLDGNASVSGTLTAYPDAGAEGLNVTTVVTDGKFEFAEGNQPSSGAYVFELSVAEAGAELIGESAEGEDESEETLTTYQTKLEIPEGGSDALAIALSVADQISEDGEEPPASGEI